MGFLDSLFGGGTPAEKAQRLKAKATQKYGDPSIRQGALEKLVDIPLAHLPEAKIRPPKEVLDKLMLGLM